MALTFRGGIFPPADKEQTKARPIEYIEAPQYVVIPMLQHMGVACDPTVMCGDYVKMGQVVGDSQEYMTVPVHATVSGKVIEVAPKWHPNGNKVMSVVIENDYKDEPVDAKELKRNPAKMTPEEIIAFSRECGLVGMGGQGYPTYAKIQSAIEKQVDTLIINGAECEPIIAADERAMIEYPKFIIGGIRMLMKALGLSNAYVGIEKDKGNAISTMSIIAEPYGIKIVPLHTKYPQGSERQLVFAVTHREIKPGEQAVDAGCAVFNVDTAASLYRCATTGMPLLRRVVTVAGDCVKTKKNALVRIGTPLQFIIESVGGFVSQPQKIILGGPMMGSAQHTLEAPMIKQCSGLLAFSKEYAFNERHGNCIRCGRCVDGCPAHLMPAYINMFFKLERYDDIEKYNASDCIECGACSYVCPSKIPLVQIMRMAKFLVNNSEYEEEYEYGL